MPSRRPRLAKLTRPRLHNAVARERLFNLLDDNSEHGLIWLVGPPGAGKTTLVASWLDARNRTGIWYQADTGDSDLATFFYYLGQAALSLTRRGKRPLPLLTPEYLHDIEGFSVRFFRELFSRLPDDSVLVLDNYQEVPAEAQFHTAVSAAMSELRPGIVLLIVSRVGPPPPYARLVAHQRIRFLSWEELRLSRQEAEAIAAQKVNIDAQTLQALYLITGGWAAGLVLALEQFRQGGSLSQAEQTTQEAIFSYFATQIFDRVPQDMRRFLMVSALLPQMSIPVCGALTADKRALDRLEDLYRRHLFTDRRSGTTLTYSYHALFRNFLLQCAARALRDEELRELRLRAAQLLEEAGESESAVRLYCEAQQWSEAERLIVQEAPKLLAQGCWQTFDEWTGWLPEGRRTESAWLVYWTGMAHLAMEPSPARALLQKAYSMFQALNDRMGCLLAASAVAHGLHLEAGEFRELDEWLPALEELLVEQNEFPSPAVELQACSGMLIAIIFGRPGHPLAGRCAARILALMSEPIDANQRITAAAAMMLYTLYTGEIRLGRQLEALVQPVLAAPELTALNAAFWYCYLGYLSVVDHTLERGHAAFGHAEEIAEREGFPYVLTSAYSGRSALLRVGDVDYWLKLAEPSMDSARPYDVVLFLGNSLYRAADRGDWASAAEFGRRTISYLEHTGTLYQRLIFEVPASWALAELGRIDEARQHLAVSDRMIKKTGAYCYQALVTLAHANIARIERQEDEYVRLLRTGFHSAAQDLARGRLAFWVPTAGAPRLCADALDHDIETPFVRQYICEYPLSPPVDAPEVWPWPIRVYTLGRFEIVLNDEPVAFTHKQPRKPLALLKALIALGEIDIPVQKLIDALWPDKEGDAAENALEVALLRLRKVLVVNDAVRLEDRSLSLNRERVWTDVRALDALTASISSGNDETQISWYANRVFALYKGGFLAADMDAPWAVSRRERTRARFMQFISAMAARHETQQDWDEALRWYHKGLEVDDLAEAFYQGVMRCYLALGKRAEGLSAFRRMRQALSVSFGIIPSPASESLHRALQSD